MAGVSLSRKGFRFLEHTSDAYVEAYGPTLGDAFAEAARGMFEVMVDTSRVEPRIEEEVELEADSLEVLLVSWLEELLYKFDAEGKVYSEFDVEVAEGEVYRLKARVRGEEYSPEKHMPKTDIKAVTYGMMEISKGEEGWKLRVLFDI
ncbi:MAG: archease [Thermoproteota archaeon]|nr:MAG: archease [Candidatus Korarchaeota archaeon]RLG54170.1 MAG: archease [Candidatus Korarchaeota archaeon]